MILIMAAGEVGRWKGASPKELVPIAGEPLVVRTIRQLGERGEGRPVVVTHKPEIQRLVHRFFIPHARRWWPETLLSTKELWRGCVVILQGDVVYSDRVLDMVLAERGLRVFGTLYGKWETFALTFGSEHPDRIEKAACEVIRHGEGGRRALLWEVYRALCGIPLSALRTFEKTVWKDVKEGALEEWTNDFDTVEGYHKFLEEQPWLSGVS